MTAPNRREGLDPESLAMLTAIDTELAGTAAECLTEDLRIELLNSHWLVRDLHSVDALGRIGVKASLYDDPALERDYVTGAHLVLAGVPAEVPPAIAVRAVGEVTLLPLTPWRSIAQMLDYEPMACTSWDDSRVEALRFKIGDFAVQRGQLLQGGGKS